MYVVCVWTYVTLEPLSMIVDRYSGLDGSGGPRRRLVTDYYFIILILIIFWLYWLFETVRHRKSVCYLIQTQAILQAPEVPGSKLDCLTFIFLFTSEQARFRFGCLLTYSKSRPHA